MILLMHLPKVLSVHVCVDLRRRNVGVAEHFLYGAQVGAGIVADSDPKTEWLETGSKARGLVLAIRMAATEHRS